MGLFLEKINTHVYFVSGVANGLAKDLIDLGLNLGKIAALCPTLAPALSIFNTVMGM